MSFSSLSNSPPLLASASTSLKIWSWDSTNPGDHPKIANQYQSTDHYNCLAWNHSNQVVAVGGRDAKIDLIQVTNGSLLTSLPLAESLHSSSSIRALAFAHNSKFLASSIGSPIQLWDLKTKQIKALFIGHRNPITALSFTTSGSVYAVDDVGIVKLWSYKSPEKSMQDLIDPSASHLSSHMSAQCMQLSYLGTSLAIGYGDGTMRIWDSNTGSVLRKQRHHSTKLSGLSWSPRNPRLLATVGMDEKLYLINTSEPANTIAEVVDVQEKLTSVTLHENGYSVAVGTATGNILLYDWRKTSAPIAKVDGHGPHAVNALSYQVPRYGAQPQPQRSDLMSESSSRHTRANSAEDDVARRMNHITPATTIISLNSKAPTPPSEKSADMSRSSTPSRLSTTSTHTGPSDQNQLKIIPDEIAYRHSSVFDEAKATLSDPVGVATGAMHSTLPKTQKVSLGKNSSLQNGHTFLGTNQEIVVAKSNYVVSGSEKSLKPLAVLESPRASLAPSRNRYGLTKDLTMDDLSISEISRSEKLPSSSSHLATLPSVNDDSKVFTMRPSEEIQFRNEIMQIEKQVNAVSGSDQSKVGDLVPANSPSQSQRPNTDHVQSIKESFASKYEARAKEIYNAAGYNTSSPVDLIGAPSSSNHRDYMRDEEVLLEKSYSPLKNEFSALRQAIRPITSKDLEESLELLKYDIHREVQEIIREQVRQFSIAKVSCYYFIFISINKLLYSLRMIQHILFENYLCNSKNCSLQIKS